MNFKKKGNEKRSNTCCIIWKVFYPCFLFASLNTNFQGFILFFLPSLSSSPEKKGTHS